ncbi:hypothetical protein Q4577_00125 [Marinovum sp. 2_MG-2023]|uniref:hypothetical protein n=1 Tax=Roseobacteraceae TaxID=2854170 RepID=UPI001FD13C62|nr:MULTISPECIES: hypothetical protein [Roseobacteraceae]MCJ7871576.1 hypothetical protein [Phaeobacter sp. J2-8]MDO6728400.1 hypothetical protein [Marinovum sp. 2_MG-2023]MDO6778184.1 hypothetical protein [Marinovum sp. 1_MG-2023]
MSDRLDIPLGEHGLVRVFTLDLPLEEAEPLLDDNALGMTKMTGATTLDPDHIDLFDMNDLSGLPLAEYLADGHGIAEEELAPHRAQLDRVKGRVVVMRSAAFEGLGQSLRVANPLRWIATFGEATDKVPLEKPRAAAADTTVIAAPVSAPIAPNRLNAGVIVALAVAVIILAFLVGVA